MALPGGPGDLGLGGTAMRAPGDLGLGGTAMRAPDDLGLGGTAMRAPARQESSRGRRWFTAREAIAKAWEYIHGF